jgi:uncharacterized protein
MNASVKQIWRYPVKSMRGESLEMTSVGWHGIAGDRRYAFVRSENRSGFPWLTGTKFPALTRYAARLEHPEKPDSSGVRVTGPDGLEHDLQAAALAAELGQGFGETLQVIKSDRGVFDELPISIIGAQTLTALEAESGVTLDNRRFRANIVLEMPDDSAFLEDSWINSRLEFSSGLQVRINLRSVRCAMINLDPITAESDPRVLKTVVKSRATCAGVYASVERTGELCVGDQVRITAL